MLVENHRVSPPADAEAVLDRSRLLSQHQAAIVLLQQRVSQPQQTRVRWLDLACGRGQIIASLHENLTDEARRSLEYYAYDLNEPFTRSARRMAERLDLARVDVKIGALHDFSQFYERGFHFDFITLTNTLHEISPEALAQVLVDGVLRLHEAGDLFLYDLECVTPNELGAVPWTRDEAKAFVHVLTEKLAGNHYRPEVGKWTHRTTTAWNVTISKAKMGGGRLEENRTAAIDGVTAEVRRLLKDKLGRCVRALETLTTCGRETQEEEAQEVRLLYEYWAVTRALGGAQ